MLVTSGSQWVKCLGQSQGEVSRGYGTSNYSARLLTDVSLA